MLQAGADALEEDPLSRLSLSNNAYFAVVEALMPLAPRLVVLGGGGYNPVHGRPLLGRRSGRRSMPCRFRPGCRRRRKPCCAD